MQFESGNVSPRASNAVAKLPWSKPLLKKMNAGSAENGIDPDIPDGLFSKS